jgi:hypothetical protein
MSAWGILASLLAVALLARLGRGMFRPDPDRWRGNLMGWVLRLIAFLVTAAVLLYGVIRFVWLATRK